jgi:hypothetical protein
MQHARLLWLIALSALVVTAVSAALAVDLTQPVRDPEFIRACRRQDRELKSFYSVRIFGSFSFCHLGSFRAQVHRDGLQRSLTLVPVRSLPYASAEALEKAARVKPVVVGALRMTYGQTSPFLAPGDMLLVYDSVHIQVRDGENFEINKFDAGVKPALSTASVDEQIGSISGSSFSLANVSPDGVCSLYLQLADSKGKEQQDATGYVKLDLSFSVPGLISDDDSLPENLAKPEEKK